MNTVCIPDRFYGDNIKVNLFERVTCKSAKLMTKSEIANSSREKESDMIEIPIRDFINLGEDTLYCRQERERQDEV